ncbi:hypothetical protein QJS10_CPA06g00526 [Acorus calamus]|uniref:Uncharacterized protein n=1 Tax=Acorus calamus TaxID=4465 RepID=A0AAV9ENM6_ACOCL|nr:hypothetical protein QJS10_CPA06g00526 [Acorus calamus]
MMNNDDDLLRSRGLESYKKIMGNKKSLHRYHCGGVEVEENPLKRWDRILYGYSVSTYVWLYEVKVKPDVGRPATYKHVMLVEVRMWKWE